MAYGIDIAVAKIKWGGHVEIFAASKLFGVGANIFLYESIDIEVS